MSVHGFIADPFDGWNDPYGFPEFEIFGTKVGTADALARGTDDQIAKAEKGLGLSKYNAETHQSRFFQAPTNNIGAYYRAAYWLAVGARVLIGRGETAAANRLIKQAKANRSWLGVKLLTAVPFSPEQGKETAIMRSAGKMAQSAGLTSIAKILGVLPGRIPFARKTRAQKGLEQAVPDAIVATAKLQNIETGKRPWWFWPVIGGVGLITLAVVLRPYAELASAKKGE